MPLNIDLNVCPSSEEVNIDLNVCPSNEEAHVDLNVYPPHEEEANEKVNEDMNLYPPNEEVNVDLNNHQYEEEANVNIDPSYEYEVDEEDIFNNEIEEISSNSIPNNFDDISLNETIGNSVDESQSTQKKRFLNNTQRTIISELLINSCCDGKLKREIVKKLASSYSVSRDVIYRIWKQINETGDASHKKTKNCGRKRVEIDFEKIRDIPLRKRGTLRSLAKALGVKSKSTLEKYLKEGVLRRHSSTLKPYLKDDNMKERVIFCFNMIEEHSIPHDPIFKSMDNIVHIDEKWFNITKNSRNYYVLADEDDPYRTCKNKNYIQKVMFLVAVARPRYDEEGNMTFDGKIGVFPLVELVPARRSSVNRAAGTLEIKPIHSITKEVSRRFLIEKVLVAIKEKWPREDAYKTIFIQQDNAPCHVSPNDEEFCRAASEGGFDIRLICQPPNSPDLNVLDLGFFSAIQSLQQQEVTRTVDELIQAVEKSYNSFDCKKSNMIFLTLQSCMVEIMKTKGSNNYKIPHMKKDVLFNQGMLPTQLKCDRELVRDVYEYLQNN